MGATLELTDAANLDFANVPFNNQGGTVTAAAGTLGFGEGTNTGGIYNAAVGAAIILNEGASSESTFTGTYTGSGGGTVSATSSSGTMLIGSAGVTFNFSAGLFIWSNGVMEGDGSATNPSVITNLGTITFSSNGIDLNNGLVINNNGTILNSSGIIILNQRNPVQSTAGVSLNNLSGGLIDFTAGGISAIGPFSNSINNETGAVFESTGSDFRQRAF